MKLSPLLFSCLLKSLSEGIYASRCSFLTGSELWLVWHSENLLLSNLERAWPLTCSHGWRSFWQNILAISWGGRWYWEEDILMLEDPVASSTWKLNCSGSIRIIEFRVMNCHEAGLELLWYNPGIALWLNCILKGGIKFGIMVWMPVWKEFLVKDSVETTAASFEHSLHGWIYCWGTLKLIMLQGTNMRSMCCTCTVYVYCFIRCVVLSNGPLSAK